MFRPKDKFKPKEIITIPPTIPDKSNWEENESQSSQAAPHSPQVAPPSLQVAPPSLQVAPPAPRPPPQFDLILVRHGISCGNLAKKKGQRLLQYSYTDPELTTMGRAKAKALGPYLKAKLDWPIVVGSSNLLRAQQTAFLMLDPKEVLIVPYISEKGMGEDNRAFSKQGQKTILEQYTCGDMEGARMNWTYFDEAPKASTPSSAKFLEWLKSNYMSLDANHKNDRDTYFSSIAERRDDTTLVFFSHGRFIRDFILEQVTANPAFKEKLFPSVPFHLMNGKAFDKLLHDAMKNYTATQFRIKIDERIQIENIEFLKYEKDVPYDIREKYEYRKDLDVAEECEADGCRKRICEGTLFRTRRSQQNVCKAARTRKVPAHESTYLNVMVKKAKRNTIRNVSKNAANVRTIRMASAAEAARLTTNIQQTPNSAVTALLTARLPQGNAPPPSNTSIGNSSANIRANNRNNNNIEEIEVVPDEYTS